MKNSVAHIGRLVVAGLVALVSASSLDAAGTASAQFLKLGAGARAAGMGDAYVAVADDVTGAYWNPAGLAQVETPEVALMHNDWLVDTQYQYVGGALPMKRGVVGASIQRMDYGSIDKYTAADAREGSFDAGSMAANVTFGMPLNNGLLVGGTVKYISETIESESATGFAGDLGVLYRRENTSFGASVSNLGSAMKMVRESYDLPRLLRIGAAHRLMENRLLLSAGVTSPSDNDPAVHAGAEFQLTPMIAFRGGYSATPGNNLDVDGLTGVTAGFGLTLNAFNLDYALVPFGDLGMTHRLSLRIKFASRN